MYSNITDSYKFILGDARRSKKQYRNDVKKKLNDLRVNAPEVMLKITSFSTSNKQVVDHLSYITRNGNVPVFDSYDRDVSEERAAGDIARDIAEIKGRKTMNMILSMPPGTPENAFVDATQDYLKKHFGNHDYHYAFHNNTECYHVHVVVPMVDRNLNRINPRKADLEKWREGFAEELEIKGVPANAMKSLARGKFPKNKTRFQTAKDMSVLFEHGEAHFENDPDNNMSYYAILERKGIKKTYWGVGIKDALEISKVKLGDNIKLSRAAKEEISLNVDIRKNGKVIGKKKIDTHRNGWVVRSKKSIEEDNSIKPLSGELKKKVISAWRYIYKDMVDNKDRKTAESINQLMKDSFKTSFMFRDQHIVEDNELTR